jgi:hypothetical protein
LHGQASSQQIAAGLRSFAQIRMTRCGLLVAEGACMLRIALLLPFVVACATDSTDDTTGGGGKADGQTPTITFAKDYSQSVSGSLLAGSPMRVKYDPARLTDCKGSSGGSEVWGITGFAMFDGGEPKSFAVTELRSGKVVAVPATVEIPARVKSVGIWFETTNTWGCHAYDSNFGANYEFDVQAGDVRAVLAFDADGSFTQDGTIHAGDQVILHYDPERLAKCAASTGGHPAWGVTGYWQVDHGTVHQLQVGQVSGSTLVAGDPPFTVSRGSDLAVWFDASNIYGCHEYDSNLGANYHAKIEQ